MKICSVKDMHDLDQQAIENYGITQEMLMENAGNAAFFTLMQHSTVAGKNILVFCGGGNNGGDGLVVARKAHSNGAKVRVFLLSDPQKYNGSAKLNYEIAFRLSFPVDRLTSSEQARQALKEADIIVDAIFGTGLTRTVEGLYAEIIEAINSARKTVFSIDIPSGINGNTGQVMGTAIQADFTTTFGLPKYGNLFYPGFAHGGQLSVTHISFPPEHYQRDHIFMETNQPPALPPRAEDAHKGGVGKALFIAGSQNYLGAPYFATMSFLKSGGGLSFLATPKPVAPLVANRGPEIILFPMEATENGSLSTSNRDAIMERAARVDFTVLGPGLSIDKDTIDLVHQLSAEIETPLLIDGDGLSAISIRPEILQGRTAATILTPHLGEMSRLCGHSVEEIQKDRVSLLRSTAQKLKSIIVLKGAHSLIGFPDGTIRLNLTGNSGMATAGSGDTLTGTIAALFGLGLMTEEAVAAGVFIHGFAGDLAAKQTGQDGLTAGDILNALPQAMRQYRKQHTEVIKDYGGKIHLI